MHSIHFSGFLRVLCTTRLMNWRPLAASACAVLLLGVTPSAWAFDLGTLMQNLGKHKERHGQFVETRHLAVLKQPLRSSGEVRYVAPDLFEKKTLEPAQDVMQVKGDQLYMEKDGRKYRIQLSKQPQVAAFVDAIAGLLKGDAQTLTRTYEHQLEGQASQWTLTLVPKDKKMRDIVRQIIAKGDKDQLRSIEYWQADGDRSVMVVQPLVASQTQAQKQAQIQAPKQVKTQAPAQMASQAK